MTLYTDYTPGRLFSTSYSSDGIIPTSTYSEIEPTSTYEIGGSSRGPIMDLCGLTPQEAQYAIKYAASERKAAEQRSREHRKMREALMRRQGFDEEYIRTH